MLLDHRKYNYSHKEERAEYMRNYRKENKEAIREYYAEYRRKKRGSVKTGERRKYVRKAPLVTQGMKPQDALARFGLSIDDVKKIINN